MPEEAPTAECVISYVPRHPRIQDRFARPADLLPMARGSTAARKFFRPDPATRPNWAFLAAAVAGSSPENVTRPAPTHRDTFPPGFAEDNRVATGWQLNPRMNPKPIRSGVAP